MELFVVNDEYDMSLKAANIIAELIKEKNDAVLGLATGSTPLGTYAELVHMHREQSLSFRSVKTFNLDEYIGLAADHPQSYRYFMNKNLFSQIDIAMINTHVPSGISKDFKKSGEAYDKAIEDAGGIDLQLLGIGRNGHIGFNEPNDFFVAATHEVTLAKGTLAANRRFFADNETMPQKAITMGMKSILNARRILLLAYGKNKAKAIAKLFLGNVTPKMPASILQLHADAMVICDREAVSAL